MADGSIKTFDFGTNPATKAVAERLDEQYHRIFQVQGSIETAMKALDAEVEDNKFTSVFSALALATQTLTDIANQIEPPTILKNLSAADNAKPATAPPDAVLIPANPLCCADDALGTIYNAHNIMELIDALDCNEGTSEFEMPNSGRSSIALLRTLVLDSMQYAADLGEEEFKRAT